MITCDQIKHRWGGAADNSGHIEVYYSRTSTGETIIHKEQPIPPNKPSITPPDRVGLENGWCTPVTSATISATPTIDVPLSASVDLGIPWPVLFAIPSVVVFGLLYKLDSSRKPQTLPTDLWHGHTDIDKYEPPLLDVPTQLAQTDTALADTGTISVPQSANLFSVPRNQPDMQGFQAPWDDISEPSEPSEPEHEPGEPEHEPGEPLEKSSQFAPNWHSSLNKLKGMTLKEFKQKFSDHIDGNTQHWEQARDQYATHLLDARIRRFWFDFGSRKMDIAVYYVFGITKGGKPGDERRERYDICAEYISEWFSKNLPTED